MIHIHNLFSVNVIETKLIIQYPLLKTIINFCDQKNSNENCYSLVNGFQEHIKFDGKEELDTILNTFIGTNFNLKIIKGWLNVINKSGYNVPHRHLGEEIVKAGVFYITDENSPITFIKENEVYTMYPKMYDLLLFPDTLIHQVSPNLTDKKRISYAFNMKKLA